MKKTSTLLIAALGMLLGTYAKAQLDVPVNKVSLEFPGAGHVTLHIVASGPPAINVTETVIPTPFKIDLPVLSAYSSWLCMDPLERIYYGANSDTIHYTSGSPSDFDKWTAAAPGLSNVRVQDLADLFTAYWLPVDTAANSAALQLAVWEITNEFDGNGYHLKTGADKGAFWATDNSVEINAAQAMLDSLSTAAIHNHGNVNGLKFLIDGHLNGGTAVQDLVSFDPKARFLIPVPEPSTYGLGAILGLGLITAVRRRRARA